MLHPHLLMYCSDTLSGNCQQLPGNCCQHTSILKHVTPSIKHYQAPLHHCKWSDTWTATIHAVGWLSALARPGIAAAVHCGKADQSTVVWHWCLATYIAKKSSNSMLVLLAAAACRCAESQLLTVTVASRCCSPAAATESRTKNSIINFSAIEKSFFWIHVQQGRAEDVKLRCNMQSSSSRSAQVLIASRSLVVWFPGL